MVYIYEWAEPMSEMLEAPEQAVEIAKQKIVPVLDDFEDKARVEKNADKFVREACAFIEKRKLGRKNVISFFKEFAVQSKKHRDEGIESAPDLAEIASKFVSKENVNAVGAIAAGAKKFVFGEDMMEMLLRAIMGKDDDPDSDDEAPPCD